MAPRKSFLSFAKLSFAVFCAALATLPVWVPGAARAGQNVSVLLVPAVNPLGVLGVSLQDERQAVQEGMASAGFVHRDTVTSKGKQETVVYDLYEASQDQFPGLRMDVEIGFLNDKAVVISTTVSVSNADDKDPYILVEAAEEIERQIMVDYGGRSYVIAGDADDSMKGDDEYARAISTNWLVTPSGELLNTGTQSPVTGEDENSSNMIQLKLIKVGYEPTFTVLDNTRLYLKLYWGPHREMLAAILEESDSSSSSTSEEVK